LGRAPEKPELRRLLALHREAAAELRSGEASAAKLLQYDKTLYTDDRALTLVADARTTPPAWKYTDVDPGEGWAKPGVDPSGWKDGRGQFGDLGKKEVYSIDRGAKIATPWSGDHLWLRIEFELPVGKFENFRLEMRSSVVFEAFLNGVPAANANVDRAGYYEYAVSAEAAATLRAGRNVLAVHAIRLRDRDLSQVIDAGLLATRALDFSRSPGRQASRAAWVVVANALLNLDETLTRR
ncbi:MAG: hypothetical protein ACREVZ_08090, partial [Burkholderiales bacterium]